MIDLLALAWVHLGDACFAEPVDLLVSITHVTTVDALGVHEGVEKIVRIGIVSPPSDEKDRVLEVTVLDQVVFPLHIANLDLELGIERHDVFGQHVGGGFTHLVARVVSDDHFKALLPHLSVPGLLHGLFGLGQIKGIDRNLLVKGQPLHVGAGGHDHQVVEDIMLVSIPVKGVQKGPADVDVGKKVRWNAVAVELAAADVGITGGVDLLAKKGAGDRQQGHFVEL